MITIDEFNSSKVKEVGFCPNCGKAVYPSDELRDIDTFPKNLKIFKCISCKQECNEDELVPF